MRSPTAPPDYDLVLLELVVIFILGVLLLCIFFFNYALERMYDEWLDELQNWHEE